MCFHKVRFLRALPQANTILLTFIALIQSHFIHKSSCELCGFVMILYLFIYRMYCTACFLLPRQCKVSLKLKYILSPSDQKWNQIFNIFLVKIQTNINVILSYNTIFSAGEWCLFFFNTAPLKCPLLHRKLWEILKGVTGWFDTVSAF